MGTKPAREQVRESTPPFMECVDYDGVTCSNQSTELVPVCCRADCGSPKKGHEPCSGWPRQRTRSAKSCRAVISSGRTCSGGVRLVTSAGTDLQPRKRSTLGVTEIANGPVPTFNVKDGQLAG